MTDTQIIRDNLDTKTRHVTTILNAEAERLPPKASATLVLADAFEVGQKTVALCPVFNVHFTRHKKETADVIA